MGDDGFLWATREMKAADSEVRRPDTVPWHMHGMELAAHAAVRRALNLSEVDVEVDHLSYRTRHVMTRSKIMPELLSMYIVHHVEYARAAVSHPGPTIKEGPRLP